MSPEYINHSLIRIGKYHPLDKLPTEEVKLILESWKELLYKERITTIDYEKLIYFELNYSDKDIQELVFDIKCFLSKQYIERNALLNIFGKPKNNSLEHYSLDQIHEPFVVAHYSRLKGE